MKILFVLHLFSHTRHFHNAFEEMLARGHSLDIVGLNQLRFRADEVHAPEHVAHIGPITYHLLPPPRTDRWQGWADTFRASRNLLLYNHPRLRQAAAFRARVLAQADPFLARFAGAGKRSPAWLIGLYRLIEAAMPPDPAVMETIAGIAPDVVLVSPLISNEMLVLHEHVKAAHRLGIPVGFPVFSWDNLTTKGTVHVRPDRTFVWNETQRSEAVDIHGLPRDSVRALGAWRFDEFRAMRPSETRQEFCARRGFDPGKPILFYIGSSPAIAATEVDFVKQWLAAIRGAADPVVAQANILIRPHPRNLQTWQQQHGLGALAGVHLEDIEALSLFETKTLHEDLSHAHAVVGLVTSAMIEAAVLGRPVHTVLTDIAGLGQAGAVHYEYLTSVGGGLLYVSPEFGRHVETLADHLRRPLEATDERARRFCAAFVDPPDTTRSASTALVDEIETLGATSKPPQSTAWWGKLAERAILWVLGRRWLPIGRALDRTE